jgi:catechol 2,3-dioxygenase-like lactoylglutathione lyase family enzyme
VRQLAAAVVVHAWVGTREFYCRIAGLCVGEHPPLEFPGYWLYAGATPCLHAAERQAYAAHAARLGLDVQEQPAGAGPLDHIAFNASDHESLSGQLESNGVLAVCNTVPGGGPRQLFIEDPNGVRVEINVRNSPTQAR